jgi:hypothetical protein
MLLRDLVRGGAPIRVMERSGSRALRQWDRIATRVITRRETAVISGTLMVFDHATSEALLASLRRVGKRAPRNVADAAREVGIATDAEVLAELLTPDLLLAGAAFMVTSSWLDAALKAAQGHDRPTMVNSDGDPLEFTTLHFPLLPGVTAAQLRAALGRVAALRAENDRFWNWLAEPGAKPKAPPRRANTQSFITTMDDGALVLGTLELQGRRLSLGRTRRRGRSAGGRCWRRCWRGSWDRHCRSGLTSSRCWRATARRLGPAACRRSRNAPSCIRASTITTGGYWTSRSRPSGTSPRVRR